MKKFIMSLLIFFVSTFFIFNVSAYYQTTSYFKFDYRNFTKDNLVFQGSDVSYYDDLIKIDKFLSDNGYHYSIYVADINHTNNFNFIRFYINNKYDDGYVYNKYSLRVNSRTNAFRIGISTNLNDYNSSLCNSYDFTTVYSGFQITSADMLEEVLTKISNNDTSFITNIRVVNSSTSCTANADTANDDNSFFTENNFIGTSVSMRTVNYYNIPFSSSDDIYFFDLGNSALKLAFFSPDDSTKLILRGDKMPLLKDYLSNEVKYNYRYRTSFNSNASDTNGVVTQIVQKSNHSVHHSNNYNYSTKIELIPNDSTNPIVPNLESIEVLYCDSGRNCIPVSEKYPGHTQDEVMTYEVKNELGIKTVYTYFPTANLMGSYEVRYTFSNADNVTYYVYDSTVPVDNDEDISYYPVSSYFSGYKRIIFDENSTQLFLSSDSNKTFKIYVPYSSLATENEILRVGNINYKTGSINYLDGNSFESNNYYFEFELTIDYSNNLIGYLSKNNGQVVIYVPNDIYVSYYNFFDSETTGDSKVTIKTPDGFTEIDTIIDNKMLNDNFFTTFTEGISYFLSPIKEIFKVITVFFNGLPVSMKYFFVSLFGLTISVFIVRFLL